MEQQQQTTPVKKIKVCVVGAGAAGLCAARHLAANSDNFEFTAIERTSLIGGIWVYNERVGVDDDGLPVHTSMYRDLRTNLPKEIMSFPDYPDIKGGDRSCVTHSVILEYLKSYATHFQLQQYIQFNTVVEHVRLEQSDTGSEKWSVQTRNTHSKETKTVKFDAVMLCNGHFFQPHIPRIPGIEEFKGRLMHSHDYRRPEEFAGQKMLLLGAANSGVDIAIELIPHATQVYLSHNKDRLSNDGQSFGVTEVPGIDRFTDGKFVLRDGSTLIPDVLMFCTGYEYSYPFLDSHCGIRVDDNYVSPVYEHLINIEHPSMCILGIPFQVVPFPMFHIQVQYFLSLLRGKSQLPSRQEMLDDAALKNPIKRHAHVLGEKQWAYNNRLAQKGGFEPLPEYYELGYRAWSSLRSANRRYYKNFNLILAEDKKSVRVVDSIKD